MAVSYTHLIRYENHNPRHDQNDNGSYGGSQGGIHAFDTDFAQDGGKTGKDGGARGKKDPAVVFDRIIGGIPAVVLFFGHQIGACCDQEHAEALHRCDRLPQQEKGHQHG